MHLDFLSIPQSGGKNVKTFRWDQSATPRRVTGSSWNVSMTFLTDMIKKGYAEEILVVLFESEQDRKRRRMLTRVTETVDAHRLLRMRDLLAFEKLAT